MSANPMSTGPATGGAMANDLSKISAANAAFLKKPGRLLVDGR